MVDDRPPRFSPELERRELHEGRLPGDTYVRVVRHHGKALRRVRAGYLRAGEGEKARGWRAKGGLWLRRLVFGAPLMTQEEHEERLSKKAGLAIFSSDALSSSAYATEEILLQLVAAGALALAFSVPISVAVALLLATVAISYRQVIFAYPRGGGAFDVSKDTLGDTAAMVAAASLLIDYVLTVAVSTAAAVAAVTSALPGLYEERVLLALLAVAIVGLVNLRGVRESGTVFVLPTYLFVFTFGAMIALGIYRGLILGAPPVSPLPAANPVAIQALSVILVLRAFASGAVALTGTEAMANGVGAFKPPEARNAATTLVWMAIILVSFFIGLTVVARAYGIVPVDRETVVSQIARAVVGTGPLHLWVQATTALILFLAANTSFNGFPRLAAVLAEDRYLPAQFMFRADRLAYGTGILLLSGFAMLLLALFQADTHALIPLYAVAVFLSFTLAQMGMVRRWWARREAGWRLGLVTNGLGGLTTGVVLIVVAAVKFVHGAWMVVLVLPILVFLFHTIHGHYKDMQRDLATEEGLGLDAYGPHEVVVPVAGLNRAALRALHYAHSLSSYVTAVHVTDDPEKAATLRESWDRWTEKVGDQAVPLVIIESPYRSLITPLLAYIDAIDEQSPETPVTVVLPEALPKHWWEHLLHTQTALRLKGALVFRPNTVVINVPYHMGQDDDRLPVAPT